VSLTDEELRREMQERIAENPTAYRYNFNPYLQQKDDGGVALQKMATQWLPTNT